MVLLSTNATVEVHHFVSEVPHFWSSRPLPKFDFRTKLKLLPDEKSHGLGMQRGSCTKTTYFRRFCVKASPVVQKPFQTKTGTSIVARFFRRRPTSTMWIVQVGVHRQVQHVHRVGRTTP